MEWVALIAGEAHSDHPRCASPVLGAFARAWNDALDDRDRQRLRPALARVIGTARDGRDEERARAAVAACSRAAASNCSTACSPDGC